MPGAPDASRSYDDPNLMHSDWDGYQITLNHEQRINPTTKLFLNAGTNDMTNRRFIYWSQITIDGDGNLRGNRVWSQYFYLKSRYGQIGANHKFRTGAAEHDVTLAVDRSWRVQYNNTRRDNPNDHVTGNIYSGIIYRPSIYSYDISAGLGQRFQYQEMDTSVNLMDNVKIGKWNLLAAVTRRHGNYRGSAAGSQISDTQYAPTFGVTYAPTDRLSVYGAYARSTTRGQVVGSGYDNEGTILPSVKVTQKELGVKYKFGNMYATLAYFDVNQPNYIDVATGASTKAYRLDGENRYRGVDLSITGMAAPKWNVFGGLQYLHARWQHTAGGVNVAKDVQGQWTPVTMEQVAAWDPDVIILSNFAPIQPADLYEDKLAGQNWKNIAAVREGRVYKAPFGLYRWDAPSVETPLMIKWLAQKLHPAVFADYVLKDDLRAFYEKFFSYQLTDADLKEILHE